MRKTIGILIFLLAAPALFAEQGFYRIALARAGSMVAVDRPTAEGGVYLFHQYPSRTLVSLRTEEVRTIAPMTAREAEQTNPARRLVSIRTVADGATAQGGPQNVSDWSAAHGAPSGAPRLAPR